MTCTRGNGQQKDCKKKEGPQLSLFCEELGFCPKTNTYDVRKARTSGLAD